MLVLLAFSFMLMQTDAANGGNEVWPVDVFAAVARVSAGVWSCLVAVITRQR
jgi:hypothetical protein